MSGGTIIPFLITLLYPWRCIQCGLKENGKTKRKGKDALFCADCSKKVRRLLQPACFICNTPYRSEAALSHSPSHCCGDCRKNPPFFSKAITPFLYEGPLSTAICKFKYEKQPHWATPLASLLTEDLINVSVDLILAIPLHAHRLRSREFNQSLLLAQKMAQNISLPYSIDAMIRTRETSPQVGLSRREREENIKGAFQVAYPKEIENRRILLVDDVYTTGATLKEGARVLIQAGAKEVIVAAVARMVKDG